MRRFLASLALLLAAALPAPAQTLAAEPIEIFDAHLHYNWEPTPYFTLAEVHALFKKHRVTGILATSRPNDGTHALAGSPQDGLWVVPFIRPYRVRPDVQSWFSNPVIFELIEQEFKRGYYIGIGEFHLSGRAAATETVRKTVNFAVQHDLFLHAHADEEAVEILFQHNPKAKIIWAHTGFGLGTERVEALLKKHPMLWGELSYRSGITGGNGVLSSEWRSLYAIPQSFSCGLGHLDQRTLGELRRDHGAVSRLAEPVAARRGRAHRAWQCEGIV